MNAQQYITEKVAEFKLLPRAFRDLDARLRFLRTAPAVVASNDLQSSVSSAEQSLMDATTRYETVNATVDHAIDASREAVASGVSFAAISAAAGAATGMTALFATTRAVREAVERIEVQAGVRASTSSALGGIGIAKLAMLTIAGLVIVPRILGGRR